MNDAESQNCDNSGLLAMANAFQIDQARLREELRNRENNYVDDVERGPEHNPIFGTGSGSVTENNASRGAGAGAPGRGAGLGAPGRGAGAGALGRGRAEALRGRGEGFRVRSLGAPGRGEAGRGHQPAPQVGVSHILFGARAPRGLFMSFRGRGDVGRGDVGRGRGDVSRGHGEVVRGRGEVVRGRGEVVRGRGEVVRGRGEVVRGRGEVVHGRGEVVRGRGEDHGRGGSPRRGSPRGRGIEIPMPRPWMDPAVEQRINSIMGEFSLFYITDSVTES